MEYKQQNNHDKTRAFSQNEVQNKNHLSRGQTSFKKAANFLFFGGLIEP